LYHNIEENFRAIVAFDMSLYFDQKFCQRSRFHSNFDKGVTFIHACPRGKILQMSFLKQIKTVSSFFAIRLCFVINVLNNKTIILLNLVEYRLILANSAYGLVG